MKFFHSIKMILCCQLAWCTTAIAQSSTEPMSFNEYRRAVDQVDMKKHEIDLPKFKELCGTPGVYILDLRSQNAYEAGHIKGALNIGADITEERLRELVPDTKATIVAYCQNSLAPSRSLARKMSLTFVCLPQILAFNYANAFILKKPFLVSANETNESLFGPLWETAKPVSNQSGNDSPR